MMVSPITAETLARWAREAREAEAAERQERAKRMPSQRRLDKEAENLLQGKRRDSA